MKQEHIIGEWIAQHFINESSIYCPSQKQGIAKLRYKDFDYSEDKAMANADHIVKCVNAHEELVKALKDAQLIGIEALYAHDNLNSIVDFKETIKTMLEIIKRGTDL